ncbi:MAG: hypothetical protein M1829_001707 [Trizodia sp. TS-e1964]|nr:MAG: hypothetical protein M1829_001707 [Trizodia sp. TS-e1964]
MPSFDDFPSPSSSSSSISSSSTTSTSTSTGAALCFARSSRTLSARALSKLVAAAAFRPPTAPRHVWFVTGPAGCGKTTTAKFLAHKLGLPFIEGDEVSRPAWTPRHTPDQPPANPPALRQFHPAMNVDKMARGIPLTDEDRWDWLRALRQKALEQLDAGAPGVLLTCSALKQKYRDVLRSAHAFHHLAIRFLFLSASEDTLLQRVKTRTGHFMKEEMVRSQLQALEPPRADETDMFAVDVNAAPGQVQQDALLLLIRVIERDRIAAAAGKERGRERGKERPA